MQCAQALVVESEPIKTCAKGDKAVELLVHYAEETDKVNNRSYVPYVVINGKVMDPDNQLKKSVCAAFKNPPKECQQK